MPNPLETSAARSARRLRDATETPQQRRERGALERCKTDKQRRMVEQCHARGVAAYPESRQGRGVVAEFRRYCETGDAGKIGRGLYHWSIMGAGGLDDIAHYDLHGFRSVYPHPAVYIEHLLLPETARWSHEQLTDPLGYHSVCVYTEGLTSLHVAHAIIEIASDQRGRLFEDWRARNQAAALAEAARLAASVGMRLVPTDD